MISRKGIWSELPFMIQQLPENWRTPVWLNALTVLGQIGSFLLIAPRWISSKKFNYTRIIRIRLVIESLLCALICFFWNRTLFILNSERSFGLFLFNLLFSCFDGLANITFLPWIVSIISLYISIFVLLILRKKVKIFLSLSLYIYIYIT